MLAHNKGSSSLGDATDALYINDGKFTYRAIFHGRDEGGAHCVCAEEVFPYCQMKEKEMATEIVSLDDAPGSCDVSLEIHVGRRLCSGQDNLAARVEKRLERHCWVVRVKMKSMAVENTSEELLAVELRWIRRCARMACKQLGQHPVQALRRAR